VKLYSLIAIALFGYCSAYGQYSYSGSGSATDNVNTITALTITGLNTSLNFNSLTAFTSGITNSGYAQLKIKSNNTWTLSVKAQNQYFTLLSSGGSTDMPATVLYVKPTTSQTYKNITTSDQVLTTGPNGPESASGNTFNIDLKMVPGFNYKGGQYNIALVYTLSTP
jgi:hypothetical protein